MPSIEKKPIEDKGINSLYKERRENFDKILEGIKLEPGEVIVWDGDGFVYTENMDESNNGQ